MRTEIKANCSCGKKIVIKGHWYNQYVIDPLFNLKTDIHDCKEHGGAKTTLFKNSIVFMISLVIQIILLPLEFIRYFY